MARRRQFLKILGGGTIMAAGGAALFVGTRRPDEALQPWEVTPYSDPRKSALSYAILAPNPHNRQPWLIELVGDDQLLIHRDPERDLPETDPFNRQIYIGLGCFLEQMEIAAGAMGYQVALTLLPDGEGGPVTAAQFVQGADADPLAEFIQQRRSTKTPFENTKLTQAQLQALAEYAVVESDESRVAQLREMTKRAFDIEIFTPRTYRESIELIRVGKAEINASPDGIELRSPFLELLRRAGMLSEKVLMDTDHPGFKANRDQYHTMLDATPHYASIATPANTRLDQLQAGRQWLRLNLKVTQMNLCVHPVSQALQEYPEMAEEYELAHKLLAPAGHTVQMLGRLGHGPISPQTPRWALETRIMNG